MGDLEIAFEEAAAAVEAEPAGINTPGALAVQMRVALWVGDATRAQSALDRMHAFRGRWIAATRLTAEAGIATLEGRRDDTAKAYEAAFAAWRALGSPLDLALCALDRAVLRGEGSAVPPEELEAREIFTRLGAQPFLERLERATEAATKAG
jgi:hypothetical protein